MPGTVNAAVYPYGQALPSGGQGYTTMQGYAMPGHQIVQFGGTSVSGLTTSPMPTIQSPYGTGTFSSAISVYNIFFNYLAI